MSLAGKVCIITGSGSGVGRATAILLAREGARVALVGRTASKLESVRSELGAEGGAADIFVLNIGDQEAVRQMAGAVLKAHGRIDVLVNNAGHSSTNRRLLNITPEEIRTVIDSNLVGAIYCTQAVVPTMLRVGEGTIINVSSMGGITPGILGGVVYCPAKAGLINFSRYLNLEFKDTGIRSSVVIPGEIDTPAIDRRPVVPPSEARLGMVTAADTAEAIATIIRMPQRTNIPELIIRPTVDRDISSEVDVP